MPKLLSLIGLITLLVLEVVDGTNTSASAQTTSSGVSTATTTQSTDSTTSNSTETTGVSSTSESVVTSTAAGTSTNSGTTSNPPKPNMGPAINTYTYYDPNTNKTCLMVKMALHFNKEDLALWNVTANASMDASASNCSVLVVNSGDKKYQFALTFKSDASDYYLHQINANLSGVDVSNGSLAIGKVALKASYMCDTGFTLILTNNVTFVATHVQFQAFQFQDKSFGTAQMCTADIKNNIAIPIAVGCALAGLIIIVIIAYVIGRSRMKHRYEAM